MSYVIILISLQLFLIWLYLLVTRKKPHILFAETAALHYMGFLYYSLFLTTVLFLINCYSLYKVFLVPKETTRFASLKKQLLTFAKKLEKLNVFFKAYDIIFKTLGTGSFYVLFVLKVMKKILRTPNFYITVIIALFTIFPRILIIIVFFSELFYGQLHYYFYSLYLLLIPLILRLLFFILKDVRERVFPEVALMVTPVNVSENVNGKNTIEIYYKLSEAFSDVNLNLVLHDFYFPLLFIAAHLEMFQYLFSRINIITLFFYYFSHILGFSYIILIT